MGEYISKYKWWFLAGFFVIVIIGLLLPFLFGSQGGIFPTPTPAVTNSPIDSIFPLKRTDIGTTTDEELEQMPSLQGIEERADGSKSYRFTSPITDIRANEVQTK